MYTWLEPARRGVRSMRCSRRISRRSAMTA